MSKYVVVNSADHLAVGDWVSVHEDVEVAIEAATEGQEIYKVDEAAGRGELMWVKH